MAHMNSDMRIPIRGGNGKDSHFSEEVQARRFWQVDVTQVFTIVASLTIAVSVVVAAWYARAAQTDAHAMAIAELKQQVVKLEQEQRQTDVAIAVITTQLQTKLEAIENQLEQANARLARIEQQRSR